jgi:hypothetical protein
MSRLKISPWLSSSGGPLVVMGEGLACMWRGLDGHPSDYHRACQIDDYAGRLEGVDGNILVLGDEPLDTAIATADDALLIIRWICAPSEAEVLAQLDLLELGSLAPIEQLSIDWASDALVLFDGAERFDPQACLHLQLLSPHIEVSTFRYQPSADTALLIHQIVPRQWAHPY